MTKMDIHPKLKPFFVFFLIATGVPSVTQNIKFRLIQKQLSIQSQNYEPPKLAFQEAIQDIKNDWEEVKEKPTINLNEIQFQRKNWSPSQEIKSSKIQVSEMRFASEEIYEAARDQSWIENLPGRLQVRLTKANEKSDILRQDWEIPTWKNFAQQVLQNESGQNNYAQNEKATVYLQNSDGSKTSRKDVMTNGIEFLDGGKPERQFKIAGKIRLLDGLALGDRNLTIRRFEEGQPKESGYVDLMTGDFKISVSEKTGVLLADLVDKNSNIIATGKSNLTPDQNNIELKIADNNNFSATFYNYSKTPEILMSEKINSLRGERAEYFLTALQIEEMTDQSGSFKLDKISDGSASILRARSKNFSETMMILPAGINQNIPLFPQSLIDAAHSLSTEGKYYQTQEINMSAVWGQVLYDGKPLQDVSVRILNFEDSKPLYLSGWIPNPQLQATTSNGYFFFTNIPEGMHTVLIERAGMIIGHSNIEVDHNVTTVTVVEISSHLKQVPIKIFDLFSGEPLEAEVQIQSFSDPVGVSGAAVLTLQDIKRLSYGYVRAQNEEYFPVQFSYFDSDEFIHIPLIKQNQLLQYAHISKISYVPETGIIVGVVPEDHFEVYLPHENNFEKSNVVYFDQSGAITEDGRAGGGFILFNVPVKTQSITVLSKKTGRLSTKLIPVEINTTSILKFHF